MNTQTLLIEFLLGGFFAVACIRTCAPAAGEGLMRLGDFFRLPGRLERLQRSRWQWFSMVALLLVVRMQTGVPMVMELTVAVQFLLFLALPTRAEARNGAVRG